MARLLTADDIIPLVASLTPQDRARLLRLMAAQPADDAAAYRAIPSSENEFSADEEPAWEAEGWEGMGDTR